MNLIKKSNIILLMLLLIFSILPINIVKAENISTNNNNLRNPNINIYSPVAILMEKSTGKIIYAKNAFQPTYNASTTKLLTAILTIENTKLDDIATVSATAVNSVPLDYTNSNLQVGEQLSIYDLLNDLLIPSANDAANVLAEHISGSIDNFANLMNEKAKEIGCRNTHFVNPSGIHADNHYSTAYDLALIGKFAMQYDEIMNIAKKTTYTLPATNKYPNTDRIFVTTNSLIRKNLTNYYYPNATGLKTGYTEHSKDCIVATASKNNIDLIAVILNSGFTDSGLREKYLDCHTLFNYGFSNYTMKQLTYNNTIYKYINIKNATKEHESLGLIPEDNLYAFVKNNESDLNIETSEFINNNIQAPIKKGDIIGKLTYTYDNTTYSTNLLATSDIEMYNPIGKYIFKILGGICLLLLVYIILNQTKEKKHKRYKNYKTYHKRQI